MVVYVFPSGFSGSDMRPSNTRRDSIRIGNLPKESRCFTVSPHWTLLLASLGQYIPAIARIQVSIPRVFKDWPPNKTNRDVGGKARLFPSNYRVSRLPPFHFKPAVMQGPLILPRSASHAIHDKRGRFVQRHLQQLLPLL